MRSRTSRRNRKPPSFGRSFDIVIEIDKLGERVAAVFADSPQNQPKIRQIVQKLRRLEKKITPRKKQTAIDDRRALVAVIHDQIKQTNSDINATQLINDLRQARALSRMRDGKALPVSDTTVRNILRDKLSVRGKAGRRPRVTN